MHKGIAIFVDLIHFFSTGFWPLMALALLVPTKWSRAPLIIYAICSSFFWYFVHPSLLFVIGATVSQYACLELARYWINIKGIGGQVNQRALLFAKFAMILPSSLPLILFFLTREVVAGNGGMTNSFYINFFGIFSIWLECSLAFVVSLNNSGKQQWKKNWALITLLELGVWGICQLLTSEMAAVVVIGWRSLLFMGHTFSHFSSHVYLKSGNTQRVIWILGIVAGIVAIGFTHHFYTQNLQSENLALVGKVTDAIQNKMSRYLRSLDAGRGLFLASEFVSREEWNTFVAELDFVNDSEGLDALGVIFQVPENRVKQFIAKTRQDNAPDFEMRPWPNGKGYSINEDHFVSTYHVSMKDQSSLVGIDFSSNDHLLLGIKQTMLTQEWAVADVPSMASENQNSVSRLFLLMPVFRNTGSMKGELLAIIYAPIFYEILFNSALQQINGHFGLRVSIDNRDVFVKKIEEVKSAQNLKTTLAFAGIELQIKWDLHEHNLGGHFAFLASIIILLLFGCLVLLFILETQEQFTVEAMELAEQRAHELKNTQEALFHASQLSALGTMASGIAHEINNPLQVIVGRSQLIQMKVDRNKIVPEEINSALERINEMVARITKIIRGLSLFSRDGSKENFINIPISRIVNETLDLCREKFRNHDVELKVESLPEITLSLREIQMGQVLINLLNNSYDAIEGLAEKWIRIEGDCDQDWYYLRVTDAGKGIPQDIAKKILTPFFTTKGVGKGTGIGLSISSAIVADHGGELFVNPQCPNTQFVIKMPLHKKPE